MRLGVDNTLNVSTWRARHLKLPKPRATSLCVPSWTQERRRAAPTTRLSSSSMVGDGMEVSVLLARGARTELLSRHLGVFRKMLPLAAQSNARLVLVNRRDYPGSEPYTPEERATLIRLATGAPSPESDAEAQAFMRDRVKEFYDFLVDFVKRENIPRPQGSTGGLIIAGWSLASAWLTALLAHVGSFKEEDVRLSEYVRRVILYGTFSID